VPEVVVVLRRTEDPLLGLVEEIRVLDLGNSDRFDWEPCDTTAQSKIASLLSLGQACIHSDSRLFPF